ncbi:MAG TPA: lantibiotic dehydratase C-terminal domain-containing protein, partial [Polyangiaceae bacterium]|nr:lantibiotic dehydratase C-terminal domain-containing protein [Polyangiaceae bacterium]
GLREAIARGESPATVFGLSASYLHMHINRWLRSAQRPSELVLYDFLRRLYEGERARSGSGR